MKLLINKYFIFVLFAVIALKIFDFIFGGDSLTTSFVVVIVGAAIVYSLDKSREINYDAATQLPLGGSIFGVFIYLYYTGVY